MNKRREQAEEPEATNEETVAEQTETSTAGTSEGLDAVVAERDRLQSQLSRAMADLQNIRKRHAKEMDAARGRALEALAAELLPVLDNFHLALEAHEQHETEGEARSETHSMIEGLQMVRSLLHGVLERHGLAEIPAMGEAFDPNVHEAVSVIDDPSVTPGNVAHVMQRGYTIGDKVIRPAKVVVAGGSGDEKPKAPPAE